MREGRYQKGLSSMVSSASRLKCCYEILFADSSGNGRRERTLSAFLWWTVLFLVVKRSSRAGVENPKIGLSAAIFDAPACARLGDFLAAHH